MNRKAVTVAATVATVANVTGLLFTAVTNAARLYPEWKDVTPSLIGTTDFLLTGRSDGTPFTVSGSSVGGTLTITTDTQPTGPYHLDNADNYSTNVLPATGDTLVFADSANKALYGLTGLTAVTLAELHIRSSFTGQIGLPSTNANNYVEYRTRAALLKSTKAYIGEGEGRCSEFMYIDFSTVVTELIVYNTGQGTSSTPALIVKGTNASNVMRFFKGDWGIGFYTGDTSVVATLQVGYISNRDGDSTGAIGPDTDLGAISIAGGATDIALGNDAGTVIVTGGTLTLDGSAGIGQLTISGDAKVNYSTTGTLGGNTILSDDAVLNFNMDMRVKTVTNPIEVYGRDAKVSDRFQAVTSLVIDYNYSDVKVNNSELGNNVRITRGTPA